MDFFKKGGGLQEPIRSQKDYIEAARSELRVLRSRLLGSRMGSSQN